MSEQVGLPYAEAYFDSAGYYLQCPACPERCHGTGTTEDTVTDSASMAYAEHYTTTHTQPELTRNLALRISEMRQQMIDMGMEPSDDCARVVNAFTEQVSYDLARLLPDFDRPAFLAAAGNETPHPAGTCYGNPSPDEPWVIYPAGTRPTEGIADPCACTLMIGGLSYPHSRSAHNLP
jgi:hypothetical protein